MPLCLEVSGTFVEVLGATSVHKYLGRKLPGNLRDRNQIELAHRVQTAWGRFHKHRDVLLDHNVNLHSRLRFFQSVVTSTLLYGLPSCALTAQQLESLDVLQRKMLRRIVGWVRISTEDWCETMRRMRDKVDAAMRIYTVEPWSSQLLRRQFRMACRFARRPEEWAMRVSRWKPKVSDAHAYRARGRPATRWDDRLNDFVRVKLHLDTWQEACASSIFTDKEDAYVKFHSDKT